MLGYIALVSRKALAAVWEKLQHHIPAAEQQLAQHKDAGQRDAELHPQPPHGGGGVVLGHQIPGDGRELDGVDAEDVERAAAHRLDEVGDGVVQQPLHLHEEQDEAEARDGIQKDAEGPQHP